MPLWQKESPEIREEYHMITYEKLVNEEKLISPSVADFLFNLNDTNGAKMLRSPARWPRTAYNICLLYSSLIQAFVIGKALDRSNKEENFTVKDLNISETAKKAFEDYWTVDSNKDLADELSVISFLMSWCNCGMDEIIGEKNAIIPISAAYSEYISHTSRGSLTEEQFINFLRALPLLRYTELDLDEQKITFNTGTEHIETKCVPFISFWDEKAAHTVAQKTTNCYVFTSVSSSDVRDELVFNSVQLNSRSSDKPRTKRFRRKVAKNESLKALCRVVGIEAEWFPIEESWCDLAFLFRIRKITASVVTSFWKKNMNRYAQKTEIERIKHMFKGSDLYEKISTSNNITGKEQLESFFLELFINHGVYKSMYSLFQDDESANDSSSVFEMYMDNFVKEKILDDAQKNIYVSLCNSIIDQHRFKLEKIVEKGSPKYKKRCYEIEAEWRAYYVLKAAGLCVEKLFADQEEILSIDDYCDMLKNPSTTLQEDLCEILKLLIGFYGGLLEIGNTYDETSYSNAIRMLNETTRNFSMEQLFDKLIRIADNSRSNPIIENLLGRPEICSVEKLKDYRDDIISTLKVSETNENVPQNTNKYIFVSYAHEDKERVKHFVENWKSLGYDIYWDEERFKKGTNWKLRASEAIKSNLCAGVFWFLSKNMVYSEAIRDEIEWTEAEIEKRNIPQEQFLVPINLEDILPEEYLKKPSNNVSNPNYVCAKKFRKILCYDDVISIDYKETEELNNCLKEHLCFDNDDSPEIENRNYNAPELVIMNFYAFLKYGNPGMSWLTDDKYFNVHPDNDVTCVFPMVISVKETQIKRDKITLAGYEIITGKGREKKKTNYILSSKRLNADEYYCIPNCKHASADDGSWIIEPFLVPHDFFSNSAPEDNQ